MEKKIERPLNSPCCLKGNILKTQANKHAVKPVYKVRPLIFAIIDS